MAEVKEWTVMVYLAGNNNLAEEMVFALREMLRVGSRAGFHIVVQFDSGGKPRLFGPAEFEVHEQPYSFGNDLSEREREDQALDNLGKTVGSGLRRTKDELNDFIDYTFAKAPARRYLLILSGHGSGALGDFLGSDNPRLGLSIPQIGEVLARAKERNDGRQIDILGMDSCLMSMAEVACEIHPSVRYMIGAEGFETNTGWPYSRLLEAITSDKSAPIEADVLASRIADEYTRYYFNFSLADRSTDLAVLDLDQFPVFMTAFRRLARTMRDVLNGLLRDEPNPLRDEIILAHWQSQSYKGERYTDVWDFCNLLAIRSENAFARFEKHDRALAERFHQLQTDCKAARDAVYLSPKEGLVKVSWYNGAAFQYSRGLSVFFPWAKVDNENGRTDLELYANLKFAGHPDSDTTYETGWKAFLEKYLSQTQRVPRDLKQKQDLVFAKDGKTILKPSRINQRQGFFTAMGNSGNKDVPLEDRDVPLEDRFGFGVKIGDMKNPAVEWFPSSLFTEEWLKTGFIKPKD